MDRAFAAPASEQQRQAELTAAIADMYAQLAECFKAVRPYVDICAHGGVSNTDSAFEREAKEALEAVDFVISNLSALRQ